MLEIEHSIGPATLSGSGALSLPLFKFVSKKIKWLLSKEFFWEIGNVVTDFGNGVSEIGKIVSEIVKGVTQISLVTDRPTTRTIFK